MFGAQVLQWFDVGSPEEDSMASMASLKLGWLVDRVVVGRLIR